MTKIKINIAYLFIAFIFASSCSKKIDVNIPDNEKKIVLHSVAKTGEQLSVKLSESSSVLNEGEIPLISDASLTLKENGEAVAEASFIADGEYTFAYNIKENKAYELSVAHPKLASVNAKINTISAVKIKSIQLQESTDEQTRFKLVFADPAGVANYYLLNITSFGITYDWQTGEEIYGENNLYYQIDFAQGQEEDLPYFESKEMTGYVISDNLFDGTTFSLNLFTNIYKGEGAQEEQTVKFHLYSLSKGYYNYIYTRNLYFKAKGSFFAQPAQVYSNVENGIGIFGNYAIATDSIKLAN